MAVAFGNANSPAAESDGSITSGSLTLSGSDLAITVGISYSSSGGSITVSSVSWSLGSGTAVQIGRVDGGSGNSDTSVVWAIPAPNAGTGTVTVTLSGSASSWRFTAAWWTGADQTTPCPIADTATYNSDAGVTNPKTIIPANLTANDATFVEVASGADNITSMTTVELLKTNATTENTGTAYTIGVGGSLVTMAGVSNNTSMVGARIKAAAAAAFNMAGITPQSQPTAHYRPDIVSCGALQSTPVPYLLTTPTRQTATRDFIQPQVDVIWTVN